MFKNLTEWSLAVRARDGCCKRCSTTVALVAHHIKPKSIFPELKFAIDNGETLCSNCHSEHHKADAVVQSVAKRSEKKTKLARAKAKAALLKAENSALKEELAAVRAVKAEARTDLAPSAGERAARLEIAELRVQLAEYEAAYQRLTAWQE
jgi:hypothetical protein